MHKWIYAFNSKRVDGRSEMKDLLGGKGANLAEMAKLGLPIPPGFTISTEACLNYYESGNKISDEIREQITEYLNELEKSINKQLGSVSHPLLVSVRSGSRASMPGMMDTILNLGLNDETVEALSKQTNNPRFAYDSYRRLIQMYSGVVLNIESYDFELILATHKKMEGVQNDSELSVDALKQIITKYKKHILEQNKEFPTKVDEQLYGAIQAVFESWNNPRAIKYREIYKLPHTWGTAVNIQAMVFGNFNERSATGVCFTRNPSTGVKEFYGEFLPNAQGEDVVAGIRTPYAITESFAKEHNLEGMSLEKLFPNVFKELNTFSNRLEHHYKDMQDIEFTIENEKLYILQTRNAKRSPLASIRIAIDMVNEKIFNEQEALLRVNPSAIEQLLHPSIDTSAKLAVVTKGLPASPGAASGRVIFSSKEAEKKSKESKIILVRKETSPEDVGGMNVAQGILTMHGGMTSHAAVVARGMGKPCITGATDIDIDYDARCMRIGDIVINENDTITINGSTGEVYLGAVRTIPSKPSPEFKLLMQWADDSRTLGIRTNADTPQDAKTALEFGAEGIGLCRTEHMFFDRNRIKLVREMILATSKETRDVVLRKLMEFQVDDFTEIFKVMSGLPVTIRLLDPPLHEFLPKTEGEIRELAEQLEVSVDWIKSRLSQLEESNPMLGHRGCRLAITFPEIYEMQVLAIFKAAKNVSGTKPEIMIPLILDASEAIIIKKMIEKLADKKLNYSVGTMIELPRAALRAKEIGPHVEFFSFGTNDLTQTTMGISRDDSGKFLNDYIKAGVFAEDPFAQIDTQGVGELLEIACERGLKGNPDLKIGICGEHGGDPESISFFHKIGLDYVSCSPFRVPVARLAAAQAAIRQGKGRRNDYAVA